MITISDESSRTYRFLCQFKCSWFGHWWFMRYKMILWPHPPEGPPLPMTGRNNSGFFFCFYHKGFVGINVPPVMGGVGVGFYRAELVVFHTANMFLWHMTNPKGLPYTSPHQKNLYWQRWWCRLIISAVQ